MAYRFALGGLLVALVACGGNVETNPTGGGGSGGHPTTSTGGNGTGGNGTAGGSSGDCDTDADCNGGTCVALTDGGYRVCAQTIPEATACTDPPEPLDQCCTTADCAMGKCYSTLNLPFCGGAIQMYNVCVTDTCASDADCAGGQEPQICAPAGVFGSPGRMCVRAYCHTNADCTDSPGGTCEPIVNPCCQTPQGIACVYSGGCASDDDCGPDPNGGGSQHCSLDPMTHTGVCQPGITGCPG